MHASATMLDHCYPDREPADCSLRWPEQKFFFVPALLACNRHWGPGASIPCSVQRQYRASESSDVACETCFSCGELVLPKACSLIESLGYNSSQCILRRCLKIPCACNILSHMQSGTACQFVRAAISGCSGGDHRSQCVVHVGRRPFVGYSRLVVFRSVFIVIRI
jgi:hypothetical protein